MKPLSRFLPIALLFAAAVPCGCRVGDQIVSLKTELEKSDDYKLRFSGVSAFPKGLLQKAASQELREFNERGFRVSSIDDAAFTMANYYHSRGFPSAEVEYELTQTEEGVWHAHFLVHEGVRAVVDQTVFGGATRFDQGELGAHVGGPTTGSFGLGDTYFVENQATAAARSVESLYYQLGYLDVRVEGPEIVFHDGGKKVNLTYEVREGPRFLVHSLTLAGPSLLGEEVKELLETYKQRPYSPRITHEIRSACASLLADRGYADAACEAAETIDRVEGQVSIDLTITSGPLVHILSIHVTGNDYTRTRFVLSQLEFAAGDLYSRRGERQSFRNLYASGLFSKVDLELVGSGEQRTLEIRVEELSSVSTSVEVGYGAYERARLILGIKEQNLAGTGRSLSLEGKLAEKARGAKLSFSDPYTIGRKQVLGANAFIEQRELVSFDSEEVGAGVNLTHILTPSYRQVYGHEFRLSEAANVEVTGPGGGSGPNQDVFISALYLTNVYDSRDNFFLPLKGTWFRLRSEMATEGLGSELSFLRFDGRVAHYLPLTEGSMLAMTVRGGVIIPLEDSNLIPLQERFFNGGQNTVRSFKEDELGPSDASGNPIGGEAFSVASLEYRQLFPGNLSGALFIDAGNVSLDHTDVLGFSNLRYAVGPGVRWLLPIGPLRLDWGINPNPRPDEEDWVLQFSLGLGF